MVRCFKGVYNDVNTNETAPARYQVTIAPIPRPVSQSTEFLARDSVLRRNQSDAVMGSR